MISRYIRSSNAVNVYSTGAIIEIRGESFIIMDTTSPGWSDGKIIHHDRLEKILGTQEFRTPPTEDQAIFNRTTRGLLAMRFPRSMFCPVCKRMVFWNKEKETLVGKDDKPTCTNKKHSSPPRLVPMKFVGVCEGGHICDINWWRWAHQGKNSATCQSQKRYNLDNLEFRRSGTSYSNMFIECLECGAKQTLEGIENGAKRISQNCLGRHPWQEQNESMHCNKPLVFILRNKTAIHYTQTISALDIHTANNTELVDKLKNLINNDLNCNINDVPERKIAYWAQELQVSATNVREELEKLRKNQDSKENMIIEKENTILEQEWPYLTTESNTQDGFQSELLVEESPKEELPESCVELGKTISGIYLVKKLREVTVAKSFSRLTYSAENTIPLDLGREGSDKWLPAFEVFGEGIFIRFNLDSIVSWEQSHHKKLAERLKDIPEKLSGRDFLFQGWKYEEELLPRFILIHTLSHLLTRQLSRDSGYSSAALRERLYVFDDKLGLLIYTAEGDSSGSLGGLVAQGNWTNMLLAIRNAIINAQWCSNDPVCRELPNSGLQDLNKSSCHACMYSPETSCAIMNTFLDRELVIGNEYIASPFIILNSHY